MLEAAAVTLGVLLIAISLLDAFETVVLPRRVTRQLRLARLFFRSTWRPWAALAPRMPSASREAYLSFYGPLSLIFLIILWAALLIAGFGLINWGLGSAVTASGAEAGFGSDIYMSGTTFFTLGLGDVSPHSSFSRVIAVVEAGSGLGFLALVITYLPVLYQAFSRRELNVSLLDARAGSPPSAGEFFQRLNASGGAENLSPFLGVGTLGRRAARDTSVIPRAGPVSLTARAAIMAGIIDVHPRRVGAGCRRRHGGVATSRPPRLRHGAARGRRSEPGPGGDARTEHRPAAARGLHTACRRRRRLARECSCRTVDRTPPKL